MSDSTSRKACRKVNSSWLTASVPTPHATPNSTICTESTIQRQTPNPHKYSAFGAQDTPVTAWRKLTQRDSRRVGFTADAGRSRRPPGTQARPARGTGRSDASTPAAGVTSPQRHAPEPGPVGPVPAADSVPAAPEAAGLGRQHLRLIWPADAVANAKRTCPRHNSTSADMHGTAIAWPADHLLAASTATRFIERTSQVR